MNNIAFHMNLNLVLKIIFIQYIIIIGCGLESNFIVLTASIVLFSNLLLILKSRRNLLLLIIFLIIFYSNYSILYANYINHIDNFFTDEISKKNTYTAVKILGVFNVLFFFVIPKTINDYVSSPDELKSLYPNSNVIFWGVLAYLIPVFFLCFDTSQTLGERVDPSPLYEYSLCFFILGYHFVKVEKRLRILDFLVLCFAVRNFMFGGRIAGLQFILCMYCFRYYFKLNKMTLVMMLIPLVLTMYIIGVVRGAIISGTFSMEEIMNSLISDGMTLDTAYSAYYTSEVFVYMRDAVNDHFTYFIAFITAIIIGYSFFPHLLLSFVADSFFTNYGGGIYPYYWYFWGGGIGVGISVFLLMPFFSMCNKINTNTQSGLCKCLAIYTASCVLRWYLYTPYSFFRGCFIITILYYCCCICVKTFHVSFK